MPRDRRKEGALLIFGAGAVCVVVLACAAYLAARILTEALFRVVFLG